MNLTRGVGADILVVAAVVVMVAVVDILSAVVLSSLVFCVVLMWRRIRFAIAYEEGCKLWMKIIGVRVEMVWCF